MSMRRLWREGEAKYTLLLCSTRFQIVLSCLCLPSFYLHSHTRFSSQLSGYYESCCLWDVTMCSYVCSFLRNICMYPTYCCNIPEYKIMFFFFFNFLTCNSGPFKYDLILPLIIPRKALHTKIIQTLNHN